MKIVLISLIALGIALWVGLSLSHDPGMMIVTLGGWRVDVPLWFGALMIVVLYAIIHTLVQLLSGVVKATKFMANLSSHFNKKRAKKLTSKGLVALAEGHWAKAERFLVQGAKVSDIPWLNYLSAAKAAQEQGKDDARDNYLRRAQKLTPESEVAVGLTQADLQYKHQQYEQSLATLTQLSHKAPNHPYMLTLQQKIYLQLHDWEKLKELLPKLKHYHALSSNEYKSLEKTVYYQLLLEKTKGSMDALMQFWQKMPKDCKTNADLAGCYVKALLKSDKAVDAESILRTALKHDWQEELIRLYGHLSHPSPQKVLNLAESWLHVHPDSPGLLLTLGRLCEQQQLWGKAQRYFEASLSLQPSPETYALLGSLLEKMNKPALGAQYFKKGLLLAMPAIAPTK
ncbi:MAG: hypothetical protein JSR17_03910 [Proteobacteria bacterium]|nr:hypothetical protein [Pseudomonadota bacterium]